MIWESGLFFLEEAIDGAASSHWKALGSIKTPGFGLNPSLDPKPARPPQILHFADRDEDGEAGFQEC